MADKSLMQKYAEKRHLKLKDATQPLVLDVNVNDVRQAKRKDPQECGFAKACKRTMPNTKAVHFYRSIAYVETDKELRRYSLPSAMRQEIVAFDRSGKMSVGTYRMRPPPPKGTLAKRRERSKQDYYNRTHDTGDGSGTPRQTRSVSVVKDLITRTYGADVVKVMNKPSKSARIVPSSKKRNRRATKATKRKKGR